MEIDIAISARLKAARKFKGYQTASSFARQQNFPITTYLQHESGKRSISVDVLKKYAAILDVNPIWLFFGYESHKEDENKGFNHLESLAYNEISSNMDIIMVNIDVALFLIESLIDGMIQTKSIPYDYLSFCNEILRGSYINGSLTKEKKHLIKLSIKSMYFPHKEANKENGKRETA